MTSALDELPTEQPNPRTTDIDRLDSLGVLTRLNDEDQIVALCVRRALPDLARAVDLALERWQRDGRVVLFGAGTSGRLAMLDAAELGPTFGIPTDRYVARLAGGSGAFLKAVEGAEDDRAAGAQAAEDLRPEDLAFGIAASGRTPWVLGALSSAAEHGAGTVALACVPRPAIGDYAEVTIVVDTGPEAITGSTRLKAGTAQKLVLNAFSTALMVRLGKTYANLMVDVQATNGKLRRRAVRLMCSAASVDAESAAVALASADWDVKTAILMIRLSLDVASARERLAASDGYLRRALGEPLTS
jgi:N-acetylmuramic acid 6-phosphate etherase